MKAKIYLIAFFIFSNQFLFCQSSQSPEKKIDYLEQIYFSGKNKADLTTAILAAIQQIQDFDSTHQTLAITRQIAFLSGIQSQVMNAKDACEIEGMLAAGMYNIDVVTAQADGVPLPNAKAKSDANDALNSLNTISGSVGDASGTANSLAWSHYYSTGRTNGFGTANTLGNASNTLDNASNLANTGVKIAGAAKSILGNHDKSCKDIPTKVVAIGEHVRPVSSVAVTTSGGTLLTFQNINFAQIATISSAIEKIQGVTKVIQGDFANNTATLTIVHTLNLMDLLQNIISADTGFKMEINGVSPEKNTGTLVLK